MRAGQQRRVLAKAAVGALIGLLAWLMCAAPARAYRLQLTSHGESIRWYSATVTLHVEPALEQFFGDMAIDQLIADAASAWGGYRGVPELLVSRGTSDGPGYHPGSDSNGIYLVEDWSLWPEALAVTIGTFESQTGKLVDADVQINASYPFSCIEADEAVSDRYDMLSVLTHELGHVLGLADSSDVPGATMWPSIAPGETYHRDLDHDDEAGLASVYATSRMTGGASCGPASVLSPVHARADESGPLGGAAIAAFVTWLGLRSRRLRSRRGALLLGGAILLGGLLAPSQTSPSYAQANEHGPEQSLLREQFAARQLAAFTRGAERLIQGRAERRGAERRGALIWTRYRLQAAAGAEEFALPGGSLDGVTQVVSGQAPPADGAQLVVALRKRGPHGWAHLRAGTLSGGSLGEGLTLPWADWRDPAR